MSRCQLESKGLGSLSALHADGSQKTDLVASNGFFFAKNPVVNGLMRTASHLHALFAPSI